MKRIYPFFLIILLLTACNTNITQVTDSFCHDRNPSPETSKYVQSQLKDYNYEKTKVKCEYFKSIWSPRPLITNVYNISCTFDFVCSKYDGWGDCKTGDYYYTCNKGN